MSSRTMTSGLTVNSLVFSLWIPTPFIYLSNSWWTFGVFPTYWLLWIRLWIAITMFLCGHMFPLILSISWNWMVLQRPKRPSRTNTPKRCPLHYRGLECKSRKSSNTRSNWQIGSWRREWSRAKSNRVLPRENTGHSKHPLPTKQEKTLCAHHQMVNTEIRLTIFFATKDGDALYSQQKQDQELNMAQIMNSLLPNSDLNERKWGKPLDHSGMT